MRELVDHPVRRRIASSASLLLCVDYDGTLTPIVKHPWDARLSGRTKPLLKRLATLPGVRVVLVSGRALRDLQRRVGLRGLYYVGNHGLALQGPRLRYLNPVANARRPLLKRMATHLRKVLGPIRGVEVEDKGLTLSLHWRNVPQAALRAFHRLAGRCLAPYRRSGTVRITRGKRVIEIRPPVTWDKGRIISWILDTPRPGRTRWRLPLVVYVGDDQTDEDAFRVVNRRHGISVLVGRPSRRTAAMYRLRTPREVTQWLNRLVTWRTHVPAQ